MTGKQPRMPDQPVSGHVATDRDGVDGLSERASLIETVERLSRELADRSADLRRIIAALGEEGRKRVALEAESRAVLAPLAQARTREAQLLALTERLAESLAAATSTAAAQQALLETANAERVRSADREAAFARAHSDAEAALASVRDQLARIEADLVQARLDAQADRAALEEQVRQGAATLAATQRRVAMAEAVVLLARVQGGHWAMPLVSLIWPPAKGRHRKMRQALQAWSEAVGGGNPAPAEPAGSATIALASPYRPVDRIASMDLFGLHQGNPYHRANSLEELCDFSDLDFIRCAYVTILGRQPDEGGERFYVGWLRAGRSKMAIIGALRRSAEGGAHDPGIAGLDRALRQHRHANLPIIGWLVRALTGREGNSSLERRLRALENSVRSESHVSADRFKFLHDFLVSVASQIEVLQDLNRKSLSTSKNSLQKLGEASDEADENWERTISGALED